MAELREREVEVWGGRLAMRFRIAGSGPPLVYLHPAAGLHFDPFLEALSADWTVIAPEHPGTGAGDSEAIHAVDDLWDLVLVYQEAIAGLGLDGPVVAIGQSFGGMMAAELAAHDPGLFERLVLLAPIGLWREDVPIANWIMTPPEELPALLFKDPGCRRRGGDVRPARGPGGGGGGDRRAGLGARLHRQVRLADPGEGAGEAPAPPPRADADRLGRRRRADPVRLRRRVRRPHRRQPGRDPPRLRPHPPARTGRRDAGPGARVSGGVRAGVFQAPMGAGTPQPSCRAPGSVRG